MNAGGARRDTETARLAVAALLSVLAHLGFACLPVAWRPVFSPSTVMRVTLAAPIRVDPAFRSPGSAEPVASESAPPSKPVAPPSEPTAPPDFATVPESIQSAPKPKSKPAALKRQEAAIQSRPRPAPKPAKPAQPPRVVAKAAGKEPTPRPERIRPALAMAAPSAPSAPDWSAATTGGGKIPVGDDGRTPVGGSGNTTAVASAPPAAEPIETGLRPLPGNPPPRYPPQARQRGIEGRVLLRLTVNAAGRVETVSVARSSGNELLDEEARRTVSRWRFHPPQRRDPAIVAQVPIVFRLRD